MVEYSLTGIFKSDLIDSIDRKIDTTVDKIAIHIANKAFLFAPFADSLASLSSTYSKNLK